MASSLGCRATTLALVAFLLTAGGGALAAAEIRVAVASNFLDSAREVGDLFESDSGHRVVLISGSTGKHYAQITHGAPVDAFLAADSRRPERLEADGLAVAGTRFTYALGCLVLWSPRDGFVDDGLAVIATGDFRHLAIAEPRLAPYGRAAREVLEREGLWTSVLPRLVRGENIGQAFQFVASGNAELGFVACSQVLGPAGAAGSHWRVPADLHSPIEQQAVLLRDTAPAREFLAFLGREAARAVIERRGYLLP